MIEGIHWLGHASFRIEIGMVIYIDPFRIRTGAPPADVILVSHAHYDHFSPLSIERIRRDGTTIIAPEACARRLRGDVRAIGPWETIAVGGAEIEGVPAYGTARRHHPRSEGGLGFIIRAGGRRIYFAGDTDLTPEMAKVGADIALLPVSGDYVLSAEEAAEAARRIRPAVAVPMHYGSIGGSGDDARRFRDLSPVPVHILPRES
ncbi:MAG: MBL fold metallo-hydrolase [bacterium]|nr:MBL fold metallo-hydrolase [bacterium]